MVKECKAKGPLRHKGRRFARLFIAKGGIVVMFLPIRLHAAGHGNAQEGHAQNQNNVSGRHCKQEAPKGLLASLGIAGDTKANVEGAQNTNDGRGFAHPKQDPFLFIRVER